MAFPFNPKCPDPDRAMEMKEKLLSDPNGAYYNIKRTATPQEQEQAISLVSQLDEIIAGKRRWLEKR